MVHVGVASSYLGALGALGQVCRIMLARIEVLGETRGGCEGSLWGTWDGKLWDRMHMRGGGCTSGGLLCAVLGCLWGLPWDSLGNFEVECKFGEVALGSVPMVRMSVKPSQHLRCMKKPAHMDWLL